MKIVKMCFYRYSKWTLASNCCTLKPIEISFGSNQNLKIHEIIMKKDPGERQPALLFELCSKRITLARNLILTSAVGGVTLAAFAI